MKHTIACLLAVAFSVFHCAFAQKEYKVTLGTPYEYIDKSVIEGFMGNPTDGYVQLSIRYREQLALEKFDANLKFISAETKDLRKLPYDMATEGFFEWNGKGVWLYNTFDKKASVTKLFYQEFNVKSGKFTGEPKQLIEVQGQLQGTAAAGGEGGYTLIIRDQFQPKFSIDSSKLSFYSVFRTVKSKIDKNPPEKFEMWTFDKNFKLIDNQKWTAPINCVAHAPLANGEHVIVGRVFQEDSKDKDIPWFKCEYMRVKTNGEVLQKVAVTITDKDVSSRKISIQQNGTVVVGGSYVDYVPGEKTKDMSGGTFAFRITPTDKDGDVKVTYNPVPGDVKAEYSKRHRHKMEEKLYYEDAQVGGNGFMVFELQEVHSIVFSNSNGSTANTIHLYDDFILQGINPVDGSTWTKVVPKAQKFEEKSARDFRTKLGGRLVQSEGRFYLFYFDSPANKNLQAGSVPAVHHFDRKDAEGCLVAVNFDESGKMQKSVVIEGESVEGIVRMHNIKAVAPGIFYFRVEANRMCKVGLISVH